MHIDDALVDDAAGGLIVSGRIEIVNAEQLDEAIRLPNHRMVLLGLNPAGLTCRAVTSHEKLPSGFYKVTCEGPRIHLPSIPLALINAVSLDATMGGEKLGRAWGGGGYLRGSISDGGGIRTIYSISSFDLVQEPNPQGLRLEISGRFTERRFVDERYTPRPPPAESGFKLELAVPWAGLIVKGVGAAASYHKFVPRSGVDKRRVPRTPDPLKLEDLNICEGRRLLIEGSILLENPSARTTPTTGFAEIFSYSDALCLSDSPRPMWLTSGFCWPGASGHSFRFECIHKELLERMLLKKDRASLSCGGDDLGSLHFATHYGEDAGDPLGQIGQTIASLDLVAQLTGRGLSLSIIGALNDFDAQEFERHKRMRNSTLVPWRRFCVQVQIPWALLLVRDFSLARRRKDFLQA